MAANIKELKELSDAESPYFCSRKGDPVKKQKEF